MANKIPLNLLPFWKGDKGDGVQQIADASNPDAGPLTGTEYATVSRGSGVLKSSLTAIAAFATSNLTASGNTASRPAPIFVGQPYFDTTLGYPVWCQQTSPAIWVNAAGAQV